MTSRPKSRSSYGVVAAGHGATADAAAATLRAGGNAFDAAVAALAIACVAEPVLASPGGGGFAMVLPADRETPELIDFFGQTPHVKRPESVLEFESVFADFGTATQEFHVGYGATAAPGFVAGLTSLREGFGSMEPGDLFAPAIAACRDGVVVTRFQAFLAEVVSPILTYSETARALFAPGGRLLGPGDVFRNHGLGDFFEALAHDGEAFSRHGAGAQAILQGQAEAGQLTADDLTAYACARRAPLVVREDATAHPATVYLNPPPSAGGAMISTMLHAMDGRWKDWRKTCVDAMAQADRARLALGGDPERLLAQRGTTHVSVIDARGNAVAVTVSNGEGNGHIAGPFGFMANNLLGEADLMPDGFHRWRPDTRLASMMAPTLVRFDDGGLTALGSGGSNRIRSAVFQALAAHFADPRDAVGAVTHPRAHVEDGHLDFEDMVDEDVRHKFTTTFPDHRAWADTNLFFGGVHMVSRRGDGSFDGAGDPRRGGVFLNVQ